MRKFLAFVMAGVMLISSNVITFAAEDLFLNTESDVIQQINKNVKCISSKDDMQNDSIEEETSFSIQKVSRATDPLSDDDLEEMEAMISAKIEQIEKDKKDGFVGI